MNGIQKLPSSCHSFFDRLWILFPKRISLWFVSQVLLCIAVCWNLQIFSQISLGMIPILIWLLARWLLSSDALFFFLRSRRIHVILVPFLFLFLNLNLTLFFFYFPFFFWPPSSLSDIISSNPFHLFLILTSFFSSSSFASFFFSLTFPLFSSYGPL